MHYNTSMSRHMYAICNLPVLISVARQCIVYSVYNWKGHDEKQIYLCTISCVHAYLVRDTSFQITRLWRNQQFTHKALFSWMVGNTAHLSEMCLQAWLRALTWFLKTVIWVMHHSASLLFFRLKMEFNYRPIIKWEQVAPSDCDENIRWFRMIWTMPCSCLRQTAFMPREHNINFLWTCIILYYEGLDKVDISRSSIYGLVSKWWAIKTRDYNHVSLI